MRIVNFTSTAAVTTAAAISYTVPRSGRIISVQWAIGITTTAATQGFSWFLSTIPTNSYGLNGSEQIISMCYCLSGATAAASYGENLITYPSFPVTAGQILYFHAAAVVAAPGTSAVMSCQLQFSA